MFLIAKTLKLDYIDKENVWSAKLELLPHTCPGAILHTKTSQLNEPIKLKAIINRGRKRVQHV